MLDIRLIRERPEEVDAGLARRGLAPVAHHALALDSTSRAHQTRQQEALARRNALAKDIGRAMAAGDLAHAATLKAEVAALKDVAAADDSAGNELEALLASLPNIPADDVPPGVDEQGNVEIHRRRDAGRRAGADHAEFGATLGLDWTSAQEVAGARFTYLRGPAARLSRALGQMMLDVATTEFGYEEVAPPLLVRDAAMFGTSQLPKFADDLFKTTDGRWLIPTAEVSLTNLVAAKILDEEAMPLRFTALTPCFRAEAGAAGRDTRGLIRQHQFDKCELVSITTPEASDAEHERMTAAAERILDLLELPFRRMLLCSGDMGFAARKTYDLEVWLPGQNAFREISSCSNCGDFQARRMKARYRPIGDKGTRAVHTLNGSALAVGRALVAVLENYRQADGAVAVPAALQPYMDGVTRLDSIG